MFRRIVLLAGGLALLIAVSAPAQEAVLSQEYGSGVHAYFTGDYVGAYERLTSAIEKGSKDPRAFYFRGLACLQLGRRPDAALDFRQGAALESKDTNKFYDVGKSLERVQGAARSELENYRVQARMTVLEEEQRLRKARYEAIRREESRVLRKPSAGGDTGENPFEDGSESADSGDDSNPFESGGEGQPEKPKSAEKKKKTESGDDEDPFATEPETPKGKDKAKKPDEKKPDDKAKKPDEKKPDDKAKKPDDKEKKKPGADTPGKKGGSDKKKGEKKKEDGKDGKKDEKKKDDPEDPFA